MLRLARPEAAEIAPSWSPSVRHPDRGLLAEHAPRLSRFSKFLALRILTCYNLWLSGTPSARMDDRSESRRHPDQLHAATLVECFDRRRCRHWFPWPRLLLAR